MADAALAVLVLFLMTGALLLVPLGLPGVWVMILILLGMTVAGTVSWTTWGILAVLATLVEVGEFLLVKEMGERYGGSGRAFWGAIAGGILGALVGAPVPLLGSLVAGVAGTFAGAAAVTLWETRSWEDASRVGWGVSVARILSVGMKTGVGIMVIVVGGFALFL
ncbi:MAG: DUF456 family protein [Gemmatimonadetes bacterium]|nr:DUF456 domain-containing protein [Gemmatimonadota bacterium]NIR79218.1 DUF456 domain-containing protein [Gemmatimonadota bacterium]NIT87879.1 DUF456 domain-containing protein [Gemmatimonadota bacterium]NIU31734.1 DUF456 domain-containing protein [Gemmatimonadota bacterium]NIU36351.1 DUF456 family protein [Gemmatimonadota bacterium]